MAFAPKGLKIGDIFEDCGNKYRVTGIIPNVGYTSEMVKEYEQISLKDLPFAPDEDDEEPSEDEENVTGEQEIPTVKKRGRKKQE